MSSMRRVTAGLGSERLISMDKSVKYISPDGNIILSVYIETVRASVTFKCMELYLHSTVYFRSGVVI